MTNDARRRAREARRKGEGERPGGHPPPASSTVAHGPPAPRTGEASPYPPAARFRQQTLSGELLVGAPAARAARAAWEALAGAAWPGVSFPLEQLPPDLRARLVALARECIDRFPPA